MLIDCYGYKLFNITVLVDDGIPGHLQPTRRNILRAIAALVRGAKAGDHFFFHYCGHSIQIEDSSNKETGKAECIIPSDGEKNLIRDSALNAALVESLPPGSHLVALLDSCHSGSLLNLKHNKCNGVFVPWMDEIQYKDAGSAIAFDSPIPTHPTPQSPSLADLPESRHHNLLSHNLTFGHHNLPESTKAHPRTPTFPSSFETELRKKALLIGISEAYSELRAAHQDVEHVRNSLIDVYGYKPSDITILVDDNIPGHTQPKRRGKEDAQHNILPYMRLLCLLFWQRSRPPSSSSRRPRAVAHVTVGSPSPQYKLARRNSLLRRCDSSAAKVECTGWCGKSATVDAELSASVKADVIILSSCTASQSTWEDEDGKSMTSSLVQILRQNPHQSLKDVLVQIRHAMYTKALARHAAVRAYKLQRVVIIRKAEQELKQLRSRMSLLNADVDAAFCVRRVEHLEKVLSELQWSPEYTDAVESPELASARPLDMEREWMM
ncbi:caspase domain-containing protein [Mycena rosella]|uniref:Caspase domain-containing protein n=1 Tax=Mycena rosella TaxID=1033263 RepID=A0AAD7CQM2_MYCRO|nr:caspase domain-containing protein [Mycena rosella]